ncbi:MAG: hypothetical protein A4E39_01641 [Methanoregulaceae archaeon PtaB.Bin152]|nr:MAG: hypothetical protein A4E39_01641 [Methanoregulaceae archaeon PtaB.Bin152]
MAVSTPRCQIMKYPARRMNAEVMQRGLAPTRLKRSPAMMPLIIIATEREVRIKPAFETSYPWTYWR